jgi:hypothetical protein
MEIVRLDRGCRVYRRRRIGSIRQVRMPPQHGRGDLSALSRTAHSGRDQSSGEGSRGVTEVAERSGEGRAGGSNGDRTVVELAGQFGCPEADYLSRHSRNQTG